MLISDALIQKSLDVYLSFFVLSLTLTVHSFDGSATPIGTETLRDLSANI